MSGVFWLMMYYTEVPERGHEAQRLDVLVLEMLTVLGDIGQTK